MTDNDIIKALGCCINEDCVSCPNGNGEVSGCQENILKYALNLINRQKAEIEEQKEENKKYREICEKAIKTYKETKAEAVKEFAEKIRKIGTEEGAYGYVHLWEVDDLVKEMVGDTE